MDCPIELEFRTDLTTAQPAHYKCSLFKVKGQGHRVKVQGHSVTQRISSKNVLQRPVASQPINWAGQSPGAPKVLGAPSNFADLKNTQPQVQ